MPLPHLGEFNPQRPGAPAGDGPADAAGGGVIGRALTAVREHLGLQVAYVSEIIGDDSVFRHVDAPGLEHLVKPGDVRSLDDVYCRHILEGQLPELIPDTAAIPLAAAMPITAAVPIGAHVSIPLRLADGSVYGMFCCLGPAADPSLNPRDLDVMRTFAQLAAFELERERGAGRTRDAKAALIRQAIDARALTMLFQPIWSLGLDRPVGFEALARFSAQPPRTPDKWFADAADAGLGLELELLAIEQALDGLARLPDDIYLTVNASPVTARSGALAALLRRHPLRRIVLEITEHSAVEDFAALSAALRALRDDGLRIAVDDAGSGYSGLQQILQLRPDVIKLDRYFVRGIDADPARKALAAALAVFADAVGSAMIGEGVETQVEADSLRELGFDKLQGYLLGRPMTLADACLAASGDRYAAAGGDGYAAASGDGRAAASGGHAHRSMAA